MNILEKIDGGDNKSISVDRLSTPLPAIPFESGNVWAVDEIDLVLRVDSGINWVDQNPEEPIQIISA